MGIEIGNRLGVEPQVEASLRQEFHRVQADLRETRSFRAAPVFVEKVRVGRATPECQRIEQCDQRVLRTEVSYRLDGLTESPCVHVRCVCTQRITGSLGHEQPGRRPWCPFGFDRSSQGADECPHRADGVRRRVLPEVVDERCQRHTPTPGDEQPGEYGSMAGSFEGDRVALAVVGCDRPQDAELDRHFTIVPTESARQWRGASRVGLRC